MKIHLTFLHMTLIFQIEAQAEIQQRTFHVICEFAWATR
jgi:hypothetical protein